MMARVDASQVTVQSPVGCSTRSEIITAGDQLTPSASARSGSIRCSGACGGVTYWRTISERVSRQ
ncbi:MAG TPA: hypothetical protein VH328_12950, partial [Burkholderiaceae bacterium]|nr:hypothetical protein [Burkholderiaceae bacterium]